MASTANAAFYPISIVQIEEKVEKRFSWERKRFNKFPLPLENIQKDKNGVITVEGTIPINLPIKQGSRFLFISSKQSFLTHGIHKYPAKFFPELPRWLIERYSEKGDVILDPFTGSGTTNVEAALSGRSSVGIDVDPFSRLLAKVKTTRLDKQELEFAISQLLDTVKRYDPKKVKESDIPAFPYRDNWFSREILLELTYIKKSIESLKVSGDVKDFFNICFTSIIRNVSNADDNCTRTVIRKKLGKRVEPADALKKFVEKILLNVPKMIEFSEICPKNVKTNIPSGMDARKIKYQGGYFDLAITSPPYINAVDYPRTHQLEIYWLGFENNSLAPLKKQHVGTESVSSSDYKQLHKLGIKEADKKILSVFQVDPRRAYISFKYFEDMKKNLEEAHRVLKKGGKYVIVVGNNRIRGELFENWKYLMKLAEQVGFEVENYFGSEIIKHFIKVPREERIDTDWVLVLKK